MYLPFYLPPNSSIPFPYIFSSFLVTPTHSHSLYFSTPLYLPHSIQTSSSLLYPLCPSSFISFISAFLSTPLRLLLSYTTLHLLSTYSRPPLFLYSSILTPPPPTTVLQTTLHLLYLPPLPTHLFLFHFYPITFHI